MADWGLDDLAAEEGRAKEAAAKSSAPSAPSVFGADDWSAGAGAPGRAAAGI